MQYNLAKRGRIFERELYLQLAHMVLLFCYIKNKSLCEY